MRTSSRRGFTLVELLIVIAIIGLLMGLLLPAIQAARERARMATCNNNQGQIAKALVSYATSGKGAFPGWAQYENLQSGGALQNPEGVIPWTGKILGQLDQQALRDQMYNGTMNWETPPKLEFFNCPSDASTSADIGTLTYVVNSGHYDPTSHPLQNDDVSDVKANGICHDQRPERDGPEVRFGTDIKDGAATTLLLSENVHKDATAGSFQSTWMGPVQPTFFDAGSDFDATDAVMTLNPEQRLGFTWVLDPGSFFNPNVDLFQPINKDFDPRTETPAAYSTFGGRFARPASTHPEVFVVAFVEGNTREISDTIDFRVYQQLMTPDGMKVANPIEPQLLIEKRMQENGGQGFMTPPLNQGDY